MKNLRAILFTLLTVISFSLAKELQYKENEPLLVEISNQVMNVIEFPEKITKTYSANDKVSVKIQDNKLIVLLLDNEPADLAVFTQSGKMYVLLLNPKLMPTQIIKITDNDSQQRKEVKERAKQIEQGNEYEKKLIAILKAAVNGKLEDYYEVDRKVQTVETQNYFIEITKEYKGDEFGVLMGRVVAKTTNPPPLSDKELATVLSKIWKIAGITIIGDSFYAITRDYEKEIEETPEEKIIKKYLQQKEGKGEEK